MLNILGWLVALSVCSTVYSGLTSKEKNDRVLTLFDIDGEFFKVYGSAYIKSITAKITSPPFTSKSKFVFAGSIVPSVDIISLYINGTIYNSGLPIFSFFEDEDRCLLAGTGCPFAAGVSISLNYGPIDMGSLGLLPGSYEAKLDAYTISKSRKRIHLGALAFHIKMRI